MQRNYKMNLIDSLEKICETYPNNDAIIENSGRIYSFSNLRQRANGLAALWQAQGIKKGDRVLIALGINFDLYASLVALWWIGAVAVLPEPALGIDGVRHAMKVTKPKALLLGGLYKFLPNFIPEMRSANILLSLVGKKCDYLPVIKLDEDAPALISFTSGSSGVPKSIIRSHGFMLAQDAAIAPLISSLDKKCRDLVGFPVFVIANLGQGVCSVLPNWRIRRPDTAKPSKLFNYIKKNNVSRLLLSPALIEKLADYGLPNCVKTIFTGGGPVFPDLILRVKMARPDIKFYAVYGSTEAEPIAEIDADDLSTDDFVSMQNGKGIIAGPPVAAAKVRIFDNEIQVSGNHVVKGYLDPKHDVETKIRDEDGVLWHKTGDAGYFDEMGRLRLLGRLKDVVGDVFPFPIEAAARKWQGVRRAALIYIDNQAILVIEGEGQFMSNWQVFAKQLGIHNVRHIAKMPMDKRHGSKIDAISLAKIMGD